MKEHALQGLQETQGDVLPQLRVYRPALKLVKKVSQHQFPVREELFAMDVVLGYPVVLQKVLMRWHLSQERRFSM